jgi:hypothetical protein
VRQDASRNEQNLTNQLERLKTELRNVTRSLNEATAKADLHAEQVKNLKRLISQKDQIHSRQLSERRVAEAERKTRAELERTGFAKPAAEERREAPEAEVEAPAPGVSPEAAPMPQPEPTAPAVEPVVAQEVLPPRPAAPAQPEPLSDERLLRFIKRPNEGTGPEDAKGPATLQDLERQSRAELAQLVRKMSRPAGSQAGTRTAAPPAQKTDEKQRPFWKRLMSDRSDGNS